MDTNQERTELSPGDDVFIIGEENTIFHKKNGTVKEILRSGKVSVDFHKEFSFIFGFEYNQGKTTWEFEPQDLKKFILDEEPAVKVERMFHRHYRTLYTLTYRFSPENLCMHDGCTKKAVKRILYNLWGTVSEYDVCQEHDKDGYCGDGFDMTPDYHPTPDYQATVKESH